MLITFKDIKKIDYFEEPKLLLLYWDIETLSSRGPGFFPVGEKEDDYVYMIQFDIIFYNESIPRKRFCLSTIPINSQKFYSKYNSTELIFIELPTQEQLLLKFAKLVGNYEPEFEIGYNTGQFDWNFVLKKARIVEQGMYDRGLVITPINNIKRPIADVNFTSYYPHAIIQNNIFLEKCVSKDSTNSHLNVVIDNNIVYGKFLSHNNNINKMSIMALMCKELLKKRNDVKQKMKLYKNDKTKLLYYTLLSNVLKIFANLVYGETGYRYSPLYHKEVALSVTAFCRATLKIMIDFVREQEFIVVYGDTDSIFYSLPELYFTELDTKYSDGLLSKKEYWEEQIKLTILHSKILEKNINEYLKQIMKSIYLKMAYKKTMYSFLIFGKKHYVAITHSDVPDLNNLNLLLKGLKTIKHNVPEFYKLVVKELIYSSLGFNKNFSIRQEEIDQKELVIQIITNYVNKKETLLDLFVFTAKFDPTYALVSAVDF
ncbi:16177_t:CDS:2, partial [Cetraspora pellucida]